MRWRGSARHAGVERRCGCQRQWLCSFHFASWPMALAKSGTLQRSASAPDIPTLHESGLTGFNGNSWLGLISRAGTPKSVVDKLSAAVSHALRDSAMRQRLISQGVEPVGTAVTLEVGEALAAQAARTPGVIEDVETAIITHQSPGAVENGCAIVVVGIAI